MYRSFCWFLAIGLWLLQRSTAFEAGLSGQQSTTHFGLTECALLRITAGYLRSVYNTTRLNSVADSIDVCNDTQLIHQEIDRELDRLRIQSELRSVIDAISTSNIRVNLDEPNSAESHFHDEKFARGSTLVRNRLADTVAKLMGDASSVIDARQSFGQAMHTLQDFYAHSNWVEVDNNKPNEHIGTGVKLGRYLPRNDKACSDCTRPGCSQGNILLGVTNNQYLTSGYFNVDPGKNSKPKGKCSHGGPLDQTTQIEAKGYGINKDSEDSDHGSHHRAAAKIALADTLQKLQSVWSTVGNETFGRFLGFYSSNLVFTIDRTASMTPVIELVKTLAIGIVEAFRGENARFRPSQYILSPFDDPHWGPLTVTTDAQLFIDKIRNLTVIGNEDKPELYFHGLHDALQVCEANSIVYTFTDAPAKDGYLRPQVMARAKELNVRIFSFYVSSDSFAKRRRRSVAGDSLDGSDPNDIATATGGFTIGFDPNRDVNATLALVTRRVFPQQSVIAIGGSKVIDATFAVEGNVTLLHMDLISNQSIVTNPGSSLELVAPNGALIMPVLVASSVFFRLYRIENPPAGLWRLSSKQSNQHTIEITIPERSTDRTARISCRTRLSEKIMRASKDAYAPLLTSPVVNQSDLVLVISCSNLPSRIQIATIHFLDRRGIVISTFTRSNLTKTETVVVPVLVPRMDFRILTQVVLSDGSVVQRHSNALITPTSIAVHLTNQPYVFVHNSTGNVSFTLSNQARGPLVIRLCVFDTLYLFGINGTCRNYSINAMSTIDAILEVNINKSAQQINVTSGSMTFGINAISSEGANLRNYQKTTFFFQNGEYNETSSEEDGLV